MGKSAESFKRNFSDAEARVEGYLSAYGLVGCLVWGFGGLQGGVSGFHRGLSFLVLNQKLLGPFPLPSKQQL